MRNGTEVFDPAAARRGRPRAGVVALFAVLIATHVWFSLGDYLVHLDHNHSDAFAQLPWMYRWVDPGVFPNDPINDYFQTFHCPPGMRLFYHTLVAGLGIDVSVAGRIVSTFWYAATLLAYLAVIRLAVPHRSWVAALAGVAAAQIPANLTLMVNDSLFTTMLGGVSRSASGAVLLLAVYGAARPSRVALNTAIVLGAAFYPPAFVINVTLAGLAALTAGSVRDVLRAGLAIVPGLAIAGVIVLVWYPLGVDPRFGPLVTTADFAWAPQIEGWHFPHGRSFVWGLVGGWVRTCWPAVVAILIQAAVFRGGRLLRANLLMLATSVVTTIAAFLVWPRLFEISRYETYPRMIVTSVAAAAVVAAAVEWIARRMARWTVGRLAWLTVAAYVAFNAALTEFRVLRARPTAADRASADRFLHAVLTRVADTPEDTVVAGIPGETGDEVPLLARRSFVIDAVALFPYHVTYHRDVAMPRFRAVLDAVYATDWAAVGPLRNQFHVRFLIIDRNRYEPKKFAPLAGGAFAQAVMTHLVRPIVERGPDRPYVFRRPPPDSVVVEDGHYQLIDLDKLPDH
jgi:hypothetical protein